MSRRNRGRYQSQGAPAGDDEPTGQDEPMQTGFVRPGLSEVLAKRDAEFEADTGVKPEDPENIDESTVAPEAPAVPTEPGTEEEPPGTVETKPPESGKKTEPKPAAPAAPAIPPTDTEEIELVIDGEKVKKTKAEILEIGRKAAQKEMAADRRLEEAARIKREAEAELARSRSAATRTPQTEPDTPPATPPAAAVDYDKAVAEKRKALREAMNYGDEADQETAQVEYEKALRDQFNAGRQPANAKDREYLDDINDIRVLTKNVKAQLARESIVDRFTAPETDGGFADIWGDPALQAQVMQEVNRSIEAGANDLDWKTYESAGKKVRAYREFLKTYEGNGSSPAPTEPAGVAPKVPAKAPTVDPTLAARADRKRQVPQVPTASASATVPEEKEENPSDVVASMARRRPGQT